MPETIATPPAEPVAPTPPATAPDAEALARSVTKLEAKNRELKEEKDSVKAQLAELAQFKKDQEQKQLEASGSYEEAKAALQKQYDEETSRLKTEIDTLKARIRDLELVTPASSELAKIVHDPQDVFATGRLKPDQIEVDSDGPVVVDGLQRTPIAEWARANLPRHYLLPTALQGTGAPRGGSSTPMAATDGMKNPFKEKAPNLTELARLFTANRELYDRLKAEAGK
jgi:phage host-nuclease inhibitor protein Gam